MSEALNHGTGGTIALGIRALSGFDPKELVQSTPLVLPRAVAPPPQLSDLNRTELTEILDAANHAGDQEVVAEVYDEIRRRRAG